MGQDALRTDGYTIDIGAEVFQQGFGSSEGWLDTKDRRLGQRLAQVGDQGMAAGQFGQEGVFEFTKIITFKYQRAQALLEGSSQEVPGQEEGSSSWTEGLGRDPTSTAGVPSTGGDDEMDVGVVVQITSPSMEDGDLSDLAPEQAGLAAKPVDGIAGRPHQATKHYRGMGLCQRT